MIEFPSSYFKFDCSLAVVILIFLYLFIFISAFSISVNYYKSISLLLACCYWLLRIEVVVVNIGERLGRGISV